MGLGTIVLVAVVILAIFGLGWRTFFSGVVTGVDTIAELSGPTIKQVTDEARNFVNESTSDFSTNSDTVDRIIGEISK